ENVQRMKNEVKDIHRKAKEQFLPLGCPVNLDGVNETCPQDSTTKSCESPDDQAGEKKANGEKGKESTKGMVPGTTTEVIRNDLYTALPLHCRMTLSQFYYHSRLQKSKQVVTCHF